MTSWNWKSFVNRVSCMYQLATRSDVSVYGHVTVGCRQTGWVMTVAWRPHPFWRTARTAVDEEHVCYYADVAVASDDNPGSLGPVHSLRLLQKPTYYVNYFKSAEKSSPFNKGWCSEALVEPWIRWYETAMHWHWHSVELRYAGRPRSGELPMLINRIFLLIKSLKKFQNIAHLYLNILMPIHDVIL